MIYLDNAATTFPKPKSVVLAVDECLRSFAANPGRGGHTLSIKASEKVYECRKKCADFFGAKSVENVVFTQSCTTSINIILKGCLKKGDHVICSSLEHNAVLRPLNQLKKSGVEFDIARVFPYDDYSTLNSFEALIKKNTKMIICTHASNVFGFVLPLKKIGELCRENGLLFAVDAAQSAGVLDINTNELEIDFLAVAPHKGLYAPMGTGILIMNSTIPNTLIEGGTGSFSNLIYQPEVLPDKFESGTANLSGICGISAGLDFIKNRGREKIYASELGYLSKCYDALIKNKEIEVYTERPCSGTFAPVLSFNVKGQNSEITAEVLNKFGIASRAGLHCAPIAHKMMGTHEFGTVRIAPSAFTTNNSIDYFINKIKFLKKC